MSIFGLALGACGVMLVYYAITTNMAIYLEESNLGGSEIAGIVIAFSTVGGMITSVILVRLEMLLKQYIIPVAILVMGLAFGILTITHSIPIVLLGVSLVGFGQGIVFPLVNVRALSQVDPYHSDKVIAIVSSSIYIGQFLSPIVLDGIGRIAGTPDIRFQYGVIAVGMVIAFAIMIAIKRMKPKEKMKRVHVN